MPAHRLAADLAKLNAVGLDPGNAGTFSVGRESLKVFPMVSTGAETRTLPRAPKAGIICSLCMKTDGGDITVTVTGTYDGTNTTIVFDTAGDVITLISIENGSNIDWRILGHQGTNVAQLMGAITGTTITASSGYILSATGTSGFDMNGVADAFILDADGDTTLSSPTDDQIDVEVGGSDRLTITTAGIIMDGTATVDLAGGADALVIDADNDTTISAPTDDQLDVEVGNADVMTITNPAAGEHAYCKLQSPCKLDARETWEFFDDFNMKVLDETNEQWILNSGADAQAVDPAVNTAERGTIQLVTGDADGTTANDASQLVVAIPVQADSGGLVFEARLNIATAITDVSVFFGLTDVTTLEEPFTNSADTITSTASNAVGFLYDTDATTDEWWMCGVDGDTDATTNAALGTAPVADTYQVLRCEVDADGEGAEFFINGTSAGSLTASVCSATTNLYLTVVACATTTTSKTINVDYVYVAHTR